MARRSQPSLPLTAAVEEYLAWLELDRHASPNTVDAYRRDLAAFAGFAQGQGSPPSPNSIATCSAPTAIPEPPAGRRPASSRPRPSASGTSSPCAPCLASRPARSGCPATSDRPSTSPGSPSGSPSPSTRPIG
jgi:integrase family protein with SAM-like domain